jgi:hypothetical protein
MLDSRRVVARFLAAHKTQSYLLLEGLLKDLREPLARLDRGMSDVGARDTLSKSLAEASKVLLSELHITSDHPGLAAVLKKHKATIVNFRKMLEEYAKADTWAELSPVLKAQRTRSKGAFEKVFEYAEHILSILASYDTDVDTTLRVGDYTLVLLTAAHGEWDQDFVSRLRAVLESVDRSLSRVGLGAMAGGTVFCYPTSKLPPSAFTGHNALASYMPSKDTLNVAVDAPASRLIRTILHELGHRTYYRVVAGRGRSAWSEFFEGGLGTPDINSIIKDWEGYIAVQPDEPRGRYLAYYMNHLRTSGDTNALMWLNLLAQKLDIREDFKSYGAPKKTSVPGLDQLLAKRSQAKVFLYPVTAYSGASAEELFAETFAEFTTGGGSKVHPLVEHAFNMTIPQFRSASFGVRTTYNVNEVDQDVFY